MTDQSQLDRLDEWADRHPRIYATIIWTLISLVLTMIVFSIMGCAERTCTPSPSNPAHPAPAQQDLGDYLTTVGHLFTFWGLILSGIALIAFFIPLLLPFRQFIVIIGEISGGSAIFGGICLYLGAHEWIVWTSAGLIALVVAIRNRAWIRKHLFKAPKDQGN